MTYTFDKNTEIINYFDYSSKNDIECIDLTQCDNLKEINDYAFRNCYNLKLVKLPKNKSIQNYKISEYAFIGCNNIKFE